ncbi:MAG: hypothetical protein R2747_22050 [Pyrinomonadaceae bacterium]
MADNEKHKKEREREESLKGIGQEILGDLEIIGGMLTGDPLTTAEGKFNAGVGEERRENSEAVEDEEE